MKTTIKPLYIQLLVLTAAFIALYYPFLGSMIQDWDQNANYSHGYLIPFISGYMIYSLRKELHDIDTSTNYWGLVVLVLGLFQLLLGKIGAEFFLQRTSMIVVIFGVTLFFSGWRVCKKVSIPILYLIFMVPLPAIVWNKIAFPLQLFASAITERVIQLLGIPVLRQGNVLQLAETTLEVVDACSGIRSLVTMLALSAAFAFVSTLSRTGKLLLFASAAPIAILVNIIRLGGTAVLANRYGAKVAQGFLHEASGIVVFMLGLFLLYGTMAALSRFKKE